MRRPAFLLAALAAAALALAPALADARPGSGASSGSRGSRTYSAPPTTNTAPTQARPVERSTTEPSRAGATGVNSPAQAGARSPVGQPNPAGGFFSRNPLMAGLMGGLLGAGLFGLLSGSGLFAGLGSLAGVLGFLFQIALIGGLVYLLVRLIRGRSPQPAMAGAPNSMARNADLGRDPRGGAIAGGRGAPAAASAGPAVEIGKADFDAFEVALRDVNAAWTRSDIAALQRLATPEMVQYFTDDLTELSGRGLKNETGEIKLESGDLAEAWSEGRREYATVAMRFSLIDVTRRVSDGAVVEGDAARRTTATELWTFLRVQGGPWMLSAIQQSG